MTAIKHILCPVDLSPLSEEALAYAVALAEPLGAEVTALHVCEIPVYPFPEGPGIPPPIDPSAFIEAAKPRLADLVARFAASPVTVHQQLIDGIPYLEVNRFAQTLPADLVVMGTHGRSGFSRLLLGSVAERVLRTCKAPVLTLRPRKEGKAG